jgi:hypothetical protein
MDLPDPGSPVISAKPPSAMAYSTRRKKASVAGVTCMASTGMSGRKG